MTIEPKHVLCFDNHQKQSIVCSTGIFLYPENTENQDIWQYHELANSGLSAGNNDVAPTDSDKENRSEDHGEDQGE